MFASLLYRTFLYFTCLLTLNSVHRNVMPYMENKAYYLYIVTGKFLLLFTSHKKKINVSVQIILIFSP